MIASFVWTPLDTWITLTACLASGSCAIPGCFLFLRKQSMLADAITHAALPGVVGAFVASGYLEATGWIDPEGGWGVRQLLMFGGAVIAGVLTAFMTDWVTRSGWVREDAALGVVFTTSKAISHFETRIRRGFHLALSPDSSFRSSLELTVFSTPSFFLKPSR
ncbi:metal ABC transporter permease, partial [bacterium]|nr:metal ABC transporter permease [bacterium]